MVRNKQGVSLVETILVLAIASLLASTVLFGRDSARTKLQFGQAMDRWVQVLSQASTESSDVVGNTNVGSATAGANAAGKHIFGKYVTITGNSSTITVDTVLTTTTGTPQTEVVSDVGGPDSYTVTVPWGVVPNLGWQPNVFILFTGPDVGTTPNVYILPGPLTVGTSATSLPSPQTTDFAMQMIDITGNSAILRIDQSGNVTWSSN